MSLPTHTEELKSRIRQIQNRLGTPLESPGDIDQIVHLCHHWGNLRQVEVGTEYLSSEQNSPNRRDAIRS